MDGGADSAVVGSIKAELTRRWEGQYNVRDKEEVPKCLKQIEEMFPDVQKERIAKMTFLVLTPLKEEDYPFDVEEQRNVLANASLRDIELLDKWMTFLKNVTLGGDLFIFFHNDPPSTQNYFYSITVVGVKPSHSTWFQTLTFNVRAYIGSIGLNVYGAQNPKAVQIVFGNSMILSF
jgi:hypothetical protein